MTTELLWSEALKVSNKALLNGALIPLNTSSIKTDINPNPYELRYLNSKLPNSYLIQGPKQNPFIPWDTRLEIKSLSETHVLILNKYPVQRGHMLLLTKSWRAQNGWLEPEDFSALIEVEDDTKGLWFFNSSAEAGASQPHRHIQLLRRKTGQRICPREYWFKSKLKNKDIHNTLIEKSTIILKRQYSEDKSQELYESYIKMCFQMNIGSPQNDEKPISPYNLLITPEWISLIRRSKEKTEGFSINALGFAGYFLATQKSNLSLLMNEGPEKLLSKVVSPLKR